MEEKRKPPFTITKKIDWSLLVALLFIVCVPVFMFIYEKYFTYRGWQSVGIQGLGSFSVPGDWVVTQDYNTIWMTDRPIGEEGCIIYCVGVIQGSSYYNNPYNLKGIIGEYEYASSSEHGESYIGAGSWSSVTLLIDDVLIPIYEITHRTGHGYFHMIAWRDRVNLSTVIRITKSF